MKDMDKKKAKKSPCGVDFCCHCLSCCPSNLTDLDIFYINLLIIWPNQCFLLVSISSLILEQQPYPEYDFILVLLGEAKNSFSRKPTPVLSGSKFIDYSKYRFWV